MHQTSHTDQQHRAILQNIARQAMLANGLLADFSAAELAEVARIPAAAATGGPSVHDLRGLLWCSIDNDDSRDLDQLTVAEALPGNMVRIRVAVSDVDALVKDGSAIDEYARHNTTSVYTPAEIFPMLPEQLSTNLTSLNQDEDRRSVVVEATVGADGSLNGSDIYMATVRNHAKLAYNSVAAWLDGNGPEPGAITSIAGLESNLRLQDKVAQILKNLRHTHGALSLDTIEAKQVFDGDQIREIVPETKNRAKELIEDFMIAANGMTARYLAAKGFPSIRRVVRTPKRWGRIVELAATHGFRLPDVPDPRPLEAFLTKQKAADPTSFPDVSLSVIKLLGAGEYTAELPGAIAPGHFGLAVSDYTHSTAPNRRYPDLITQRLLKAAMAGKPWPYSNAYLDVLARNCTTMEDAAKKVERQVEKSAAAILLESRIGEQFDGIVTGASEKGTWVRLLAVPVEGKVVRGFESLDVGDRTRVQLISVDVERGFIDFKTVGSSRR